MANLIPSFVFGVQPTSKDLADNRVAGVIQPAVSTYTGWNDFYAQSNFGPLPPAVGSPKYWSDPNSNNAIGGMFLTGVVKKASQRTLEENHMYSQAAQNFFNEFPNTLIPEVKFKALDKAEWQRLSFPSDLSLYDASDFAEYPLALVWAYGTTTDGNSSMNHTFPGDRILAMLDEKPVNMKIEEALKVFKKTTPASWIDNAQVLKLVNKLLSDPIARQNAKSITGKNVSDSDKLTQLFSL